MASNNPKRQIRSEISEAGSRSSSPDQGPYSIFDKRQTAVIVFLVSTAATFSGFASNIYFPALPAIAIDLGVSVSLVNLSVTSYLIFQALAPSLWGPLSDAKGRRITFIGTFLVFLGASIGLAGTKNYASLVILRCLQSTGSASTIAIGSGVIGDITTRPERGGWMGIFQAGMLVPLAVGPVIGGALAGTLGWRAIFWFLTIYSAITLACLIVFLPETLRSVVGNGSHVPEKDLWATFPLSIYRRMSKIQSPNDSSSTLTQKHRTDVTEPFKILFSKRTAPIIVFLAVYYAVWQMSITAMSSLFEERYHLNTSQLGLAYIANGVGAIIGTLISGRILDYDYARVQAKHYEISDNDEPTTNTAISHSRADDASFPLEKARLRLIPIFATLQWASIVLFGWAIHYHDSVHMAVPIACTFVTGWTAISTQSIVMTYLVDLFSDQSASASASLNLARCLFAAGGTSAVSPMINAIGAGLAFTLCTGVQLFALSGVVIQWKFGLRWRKEAEVKNRKQKARDEQNRNPA